MEPQTGQKEVSSGEDLEPRSPAADPSAPPPPEGEARSSGLPRPGAEREDAHDQRVKEAPAHLEPVQTDMPVPPTFAADVPPGSAYYSDSSVSREDPQGRDEGAVAGQSVVMSDVVHVPNSDYYSDSSSVSRDSGQREEVGGATTQRQGVQRIAPPPHDGYSDRRQDVGVVTPPPSAPIAPPPPHAAPPMQQAKEPQLKTATPQQPAGEVSTCTCTTATYTEGGWGCTSATYTEGGWGCTAAVGTLCSTYTEGGWG